MTKTISEQPSPWRKYYKRKSCYGDRVYCIYKELTNNNINICKRITIIIILLLIHNKLNNNNNNNDNNDNTNNTNSDIIHIYIYIYLYI